MKPVIKNFLMLCLVLTTGCAYAQSITLSGRVSTETENVQFATVQLKDMADSSRRKEGWTDKAGWFEFNGLQKGKYQLSVSALGYAIYKTGIIELNASDSLNIQLSPQTTQLTEVVIASKKNVYETNKGKLTFNVQNSAITSGLTTFDMLKKLPGISIGQNDQILFRGSADINVMINGKMTYLSGNQLVNLLKGLSAQDLNKIELVTTPMAEFDAAGNAGIINVVTKKNLVKGYAVDLRSSVSKGKNFMTNQNISASLGTGKLNLYGSFDFNTPQTFSDDVSGNTVNVNGNTVTIDRKNDNFFKSKYYTRHFEVDWQLLPKHTLNAVYHGYLDNWKGFKNSVINSSGNGLASRIVTENLLVEPYYYDSGSLGYVYKIDSTGKKITADANYTSYRNYSDGLMTTDNYNDQGSYLSRSILKSYQPGFIKILSVKADADLPFKSINIKTGLKYASVSNDNQFQFDSLRAEEYVSVDNISNHFKYNERIAAVYTSASKKFNRTNVEAGLRLEYTNANGYTLKQDVANKWAYTKLFPSLAIEHVINENNKVDFSVTRRINRPDYGDLNPVRWYNDQYFYYSGNPELIPELAWQYALNYSLKDKYIFTVSYNQSINFISRKLSIDDNGVTVKSLSANFGKRQRLDFTASVPAKIGAFWELQFFSNLSYTTYPISMRIGEKNLRLWSANITLQQDFTLPGDIKGSLAAYYFSSELRGIYVTRPTGYMDVGIKKTMLNKKLTAQFSVNDVFNTNRYKAFSQTDVVNYYYNDKPYSRLIGLSLTYHMGGQLAKSASRKTDEQNRL